MGRHHSDEPLNLDELILNFLEEGTFLTFKQIDSRARQIAKGKGAEPWAEGTIRNHVDKLVRQGKLRHQEAGYLIDRGWKEGQPKAFILVELAMPKKPGESHQKKFVKEIIEGFRQQKHPGLYLLSVDATLGAEFALIIQVYSDYLHHIGRFVKEYLLTHELVAKTRTVLVWPTEPGEGLS